MKLPFTPPRLLQMDVLTARRAVRREPVMDAPDTRAPDGLLPAPSLAPPRFGRIAAELALEAGGQRCYAPRSEAEVLESRRC